MGEICAMRQSHIKGLLISKKGEKFENHKIVMIERVLMKII